MPLCGRSKRQSVLQVWGQVTPSSQALEQNGVKLSGKPRSRASLAREASDQLQQGVGVVRRCWPEGTHRLDPDFECSVGRGEDLGHIFVHPVSQLLQRVERDITRSEPGDRGLLDEVGSIVFA